MYADPPSQLIPGRRLGWRTETAMTTKLVPDAFQQATWTRGIAEASTAGVPAIG